MDCETLLEQKRRRGVTISLAIPTFNEAENIGYVLKNISEALINDSPIIDELAIIDGGSTDATVSIASAHGARVFGADIVGIPLARGKGVNLWKSVYFCSGDILVWLDADIRSSAVEFALALLKPLLFDEEKLYSTAYYQRPLNLKGQRFPNEGGRVTELLTRPLLSLLFPTEAHFLYQPMAGEHAVYRTLLQTLPFFSGYSVDVCLLLEIISRHGINVISQVNLFEREHRNRSLYDLRRQAFGVLQSLLTIASCRGVVALKDTTNHLIEFDLTKPLPRPVGFVYSEVELPPIETVPGYRTLRLQQD